MRPRRTGKIERREWTREPKTRFVLFCEGSNTEPAYFAAIRKFWAGALIEIETRKGIGVPITIAERAIEFGEQDRSRRLRRKNSFEENDRVWAVFDRDDHERYDEAVEL